MRSAGIVLSAFWIAGVALGTWFEVTESPRSLGWLLQFVARPRPDPNFMGLDAFGFFFRVVDPLRLFMLMLLPVIAAWLLVFLSDRFFGGNKRSGESK
jgi:hypothetical protein